MSKTTEKKLKVPDPNAPLIACNWEDQASPYYNDRHQRYRKYAKAFVNKEILPYIDKWEAEQELPSGFYKKAHECGVYSTFYPKAFGGTPFEQTKEEEEKETKAFISKSKDYHGDLFFTIIFNEELGRAGSAGLKSGWIHYIAVPPVLFFGSDHLREMIKPCITAEKLICLAISEPTAGSDVRNITTTAKTDPNDPNYYIVNGEKYWITGGMKSDFFVTAVRTGGPGIFGISLLLIERGPGVITNRLPLQGHGPSATAYIIFKNARVPKANVIGVENQGFLPIMFNFNTERFSIISTAISLARLCVDESITYARTRKTFGRYLIQHQVIRHKIMNMSRQVLAVHTFMEWCAYRMNKASLSALDHALVKDLSLLKVQATQCLEYCAREARQIFGGRAYVRGGRAAKVERVYRDVSALAIYGGSEEIMIDLATRQAKL